MKTNFLPKRNEETMVTCAWCEGNDGLYSVVATVANSGGGIWIKSVECKSDSTAWPASAQEVELATEYIGDMMIRSLVTM